MNKKALVILTLIAIGNGAFAMEKQKALVKGDGDSEHEGSRSTTDLPGFGSRLGKKVDATLAAASSGLSSASQTVNDKVVDPTRQTYTSLTDTTQNGKHRGVVANFLRRGQQWWYPAITSAMIGVLPLPIDPNHAYYAQYSWETTQFYRGIGKQYKVGKAMTSDPTETLVGDDQVTRFKKRVDSIISVGNTTYAETQRILNGPDREKGPGVEALALLTRHSRQLTKFNGDVMPPMLFRALTSQRTTAQQTARHGILSKNKEVGRLLASRGYDYHDLCGSDSDYPSGEEGSRGQVKALMTRPPSPSVSDSSSEDATSDDDDRDSSQKREKEEE